MAPIPAFTTDGLLPPGDYEVTFEELRQSILVVGPKKQKVNRQWDTAWRSYLVNNLEILTSQLWQVGIKEVFVDGSFAEDKAQPKDIDGYFVTDLTLFKTGELERELNLLDPEKVWTWDPKSLVYCRGENPKWQLPMRAKYRVELYPHYPGLLCGIKDKFENEQEFPAAFRQRRDGDDFKQKGIVKIRYGG